MKLYKFSFALMLGLGALSSCSDKLDLTNPNQQTSATFGNTVDELNESVVAAYNHTRMEGSYARVGYNIDVMRADDAWNCSQVWYMPFDDLDEPITDEIGQWSWRDWYYTINVCNFITYKVDGNFGTDDNQLTDDQKRIKGQALFLRGLAYYNLVNYYQNPPLITDYNAYSTLDGLYVSNQPEGDECQYDLVLDQIEKDFSEAMTLLPTRDEGGEWAKGRATQGAAAGYYARALMQRHKYSEAYTILKEIIDQKHGTYQLMANFGDNFREGSAYENNAESLYEVQFLDKDQQGTDDEWTPVNTSAYATQGSAIESNFAPGDVGGWADIAASPWIYNLFKQERTTSGSLDPRLYWSIGTYETEWSNNPDGTLGNVCYGSEMTSTDTIVVNNNYGGLPIAKWTHFRTGEYTAVVTGLHDGINIRLMRYSDVLLRAAECLNEIDGDRSLAVSYINQVRNRAGLASLNASDFTDKDKLFEQIANVERPKEFAFEYGRGNDLIRWGFFYDEGRLNQMKQHGTFCRTTDKSLAKQTVNYSDIAAGDTRMNLKSSYDTYIQGHEFLPIYQGTLNDNSNIVGNSANNSTSNKEYFTSKGWTVHPVVDLSK